MKTEWKPRKINLSTSIITSFIFLVAGFFVGSNWQFILTNFSPYIGFRKSEQANWDSLNEIYTELRSFYDGEVTEENALTGAKRGIAAALDDPYTTYLTAKEGNEFLSDLNGEINEAGIGMELTFRNNHTVVVRTLPDNPARKAGIKPGDRIVKIGDENVDGKTTEDVAKKLRGKAGDKVKVEILRGADTLTFEMTREKINNVSADISYSDKTAIISVYRFAEDTGSLVRKLAEQAKAKQVDKVILDLRNNGGGYVSAAGEMLSLWLNGGDKYMIEKSIHNDDKTDYVPRGKNPIFKDIKTIVLINRSTASASEIVAGALKDYQKATIVGMTSFGKGVMQTMLNLSDGGKLKVTTAHWYTPNGSSINKTGIKPDVEIDRTVQDITEDKDPQLDKAKSLQFNPCDFS